MYTLFLSITFHDQDLKNKTIIYKYEDYSVIKDIKIYSVLWSIFSRSFVFERIK